MHNTEFKFKFIHFVMIQMYRYIPWNTGLVQKEDDTKKSLNDIEAKAQGNRPNPLKKRDLDGNLTDNSDPSKKIKRDSFDEKLLRWMDDITSTKASASATALFNESFTKGKLLNFVRNDEFCQTLLQK